MGQIAEGRSSSRSSTSHFVTRQLSGWARFPVEACHIFRPERRTEVAAVLASGSQASYVAYGLGRSYGDAALNRGRGVIDLSRLNRFLSFDASTGVLECEAGVSFSDILRYFLPRGFFLPVTPGTKFVTVGGAVASDVHGKNHHRDGTLANFLVDFKILTPSGDVLVCSPDTNREVFWATVGGMGLIGVILSARIRLRPVESAYLRVDYQKTRDLTETLTLMRESDDQYHYSVTWVDCLARGRFLGRGILMRGSHADAADLPPEIRDPLTLPARTGASIPVDFPSVSLSRYTVGAFNALYYSTRPKFAQRLVNLERFFYPLDAIGHWNRMYGRRGFVQYQVVLPLESGPAGLRALLEKLVQSGYPPFLGVLKQFGKANSGLLSFPFEGYTLAADLPMSDGLPAVVGELDRVVLRYGGRVYLAKDALLRPEAFAQMYPNLERFREVKARLDPKGLLSSSLARRLGIVEN